MWENTDVSNPYSKAFVASTEGSTHRSLYDCVLVRLEESMHTEPQYMQVIDQNMAINCGPQSKHVLKL